MSITRNQAAHTSSEIMRQRIDATNYWPIAVAIGIILSLAGLFLILAAHQVFGINAISDLGGLGKVIGYSGFGVGAIISLVGIVVGRINSSYKKIRPAIHTLHLIDEADVREDSAYKLQNSELLAVNYSSRQEIEISCIEISGVDNRYFVSSKFLEYGHTPPLEALENWCRQNVDFVNGKCFVGGPHNTIKDFNERVRRGGF